MARKAETGIDYFPMNTDIIHNPKIKLVVAEFGPKVWAVLLPLYCKIYREKGYWIDWCDEDSKMLFAQDECKTEVAFLNEVVTGCIRRSLFDNGVFEMFGVLTSDRIQENYLTAKARNKDVVLIEEFASKNENNEYVYKFFKNVSIIDLDVNILKKKVSIGTQKKKEKKILEVDGDSAGAQNHPPDVIQKFKLFEDWIRKKATNVSKMKEPFTIDQYIQLKEKFNQQQVQELILKMHNYKKLLTNNVSAYLTFLNWSKKDFNDSGNGPKSEQTGSSINDALKNAGKTQTADQS